MGVKKEDKQFIRRLVGYVESESRTRSGLPEIVTGFLECGHLWSRWGSRTQERIDLFLVEMVRKGEMLKDALPKHVCHSCKTGKPVAVRELGRCPLWVWNIYPELERIWKEACKESHYVTRYGVVHIFKKYGEALCGVKLVGYAVTLTGLPANCKKCLSES